MISSLLVSLTLATSCISTYAVVISNPASEAPRSAPEGSSIPAGTELRPLLADPSRSALVFSRETSRDESLRDSETDIRLADSLLQLNDSLEVHGSIWFLFGRRYLSDEKFWSPIDEPTVGGFEVMYEFVKEFPFQIEFGFQYAKEEREDTTVSLREKYESYEIYLGLRQSWDINFFATNVYVGGGVTYYGVEAQLQNGTGGTASFDDQGFGGYLHTGFFVPLGTYLVTGIDLRAMIAEKLDVGGNKVSVNYMQAMVLAGFAW